MTENNFRDFIKDLKENNPAKFLEILPELVAGSFANKLPQLGFSQEISKQILITNKKDIDKKLRSGYNLTNIGMGAIIFIVGSVFASNYKKSKKEE